MLLAIDVGNSQIVLGCFIDGKLKAKWRLSTHPICTGDEFRLRVERALESSKLDLAQVKTVLTSSVVPSHTQLLRTAFEAKNFHMIDSSWPLSFQIKTGFPLQIGADWLVNIEATVREYGYPALIVDMGTATSMIAISKDSAGGAVFLGGAILPGLETSMKSLAQNTALLPVIELVEPERAIGKNTKECLQSGLVLGHASMVDGMIERIKNELGVKEIPVVATGGNSRFLKSLSRHLTHFDPDLTLKGIASLYDSIPKK